MVGHRRTAIESTGIHYITRFDIITHTLDFRALHAVHAFERFERFGRGPLGRKGLSGWKGAIWRRDLWFASDVMFQDGDRAVNETGSSNSTNIAHFVFVIELQYCFKGDVIGFTGVI